MAAATQRIIIHADDKTGSAIASAVRNTKKLDRQMKRTGDNFRTATRQSRAHLGQLGHQVQDVAVQLQMGMNPLMVFGQQGSQVASIFGAKGALVGGLIAVAAVLAQQLIPNLFKSAEGFDELKKKADELGVSIKNIAPFLFREEELRLEENLRNARKQMRDVTKELEELNRLYETGEKAPSLGGARTLYFEKLARKILDTTKEAERAKFALLEAQKAAGIERNIPEAVLPTPPKVKEFTPENDPLEALKRRAEALKRSLDPMKEYQFRLQELQSMEANNLITTKEFTQATKELREQFIDTADAAEQFGLTLEIWVDFGRR